MTDDLEPDDLDWDLNGGQSPVDPADDQFTPDEEQEDDDE